jgi:transcriptional regulator with XRE-family HTH domain
MRFDEKTLGKRVRFLRLDRKMTRSELGKILNVAEVSIAKYEIGKRTMDLDRIFQLSELFGVSIDFLLGKSDYRSVAGQVNSKLGDFSDSLSVLADMLPIQREVLNEFIICDEFRLFMKYLTDYHQLSCNEAYHNELNKLVKKELEQFQGYNEYPHLAVCDLIRDGIISRVMPVIERLIKKSSEAIRARYRMFALMLAISELEMNDTLTIEQEMELQLLKLEQTRWEVNHKSVYRFGDANRNRNPDIFGLNDYPINNSVIDDSIKNAKIGKTKSETEKHKDPSL